MRVEKKGVGSAVVGDDTGGRRMQDFLQSFGEDEDEEEEQEKVRNRVLAIRAFVYVQIKALERSFTNETIWLLVSQMKMLTRLRVRSITLLVYDKAQDTR